MIRSRPIAGGTSEAWKAGGRVAPAESARPGIHFVAFGGEFTGTSTTADRTPFHASNVSVTFAIPLPTLSSTTRTGLRQ